jgi:hypothetical protein
MKKHKAEFEITKSIDPGMWRLWLSIGDQSFVIGYPEDLETIKWTRRQVRIALKNLKK